MQAKPAFGKTAAIESATDASGNAFNKITECESEASSNLVSFSLLCLSTILS